MTAPKLFLTGVTGYIGGSVFDTIYTTHPEYSYTVLLRKTPANFSERYPNVKVITGDYDSGELLTRAAEENDIVVHCGNSDHLPAITSLLSGLTKHAPANPGYLLHLSGTGYLSSTWTSTPLFGLRSEKAYSDLHDQSEILALPETLIHLPVDRLIQRTAAANPSTIKSVIMTPPDIYGLGSGPGITQSFMVPLYYNEVLRLGEAFYVGEGQNERSVVHIRDLCRLYLRLVEDAVDGGKKGEWGPETMYYSTAIDIPWKPVAEAVSKHLQLPTRSYSVEELQEKVPAGGIELYLFASNGKSRGDRAKKNFGWEAKEPGFWEVLEQDLELAKKDKQRAFGALSSVDAGAMKR